MGLGPPLGMVRSAVRILALLLACVAGCAAPLPSFPLNQPDRPAGVAESAWAATFMFAQPPRSTEHGARMCSAVAIAPDVLVTARHCIPPGDVFEGGVVVRPDGLGGVVVGVTVVTDADVALLRVAGPPLPYAQVADVEAIGQRAHVLGYGCSRGRKLEARPVTFLGRWSTDFPDDPYLDVWSGVGCKGDSGGGVFDAAGRLVGVSTRISVEGEPMVFAVPAAPLAR